MTHEPGRLSTGGGDINNQETGLNSNLEIN